MARKGRKQPAKAMAADGRSLGYFPRRRKATRLQKRKYDKQTTRAYTPAPNSFQLIGQVFSIFKKYWRPLGGIVLVYLILNIIFASGFSNISNVFAEIKLNFQQDGKWHLSEAFDGFGSLVSNVSIGSVSEAASVFQGALFIVISLVIIWALRHLLANQTIKIKQAFYQSMTPLVPFLLIMFVIILQLLPITLGSLIVATIVLAIFTTSTTAMAIIVISIFGLAIWSIYMLSSSVFALYIVTLPEMEPRKALRSAKNLVKFRRWAVIRRVVFLPLFTLLAMAIIVIPLMLYADVLVVPVFFVLSMLTILFIHTYLYSLYRGLLE
ncbi:TPA: hypothetical protein DIS56_02415 [Candidatus Saccharibacteria bacterium]|nr:hypothetical protein [Candidatus Saccharibacteria bacterium]